MKKAEKIKQKAQELGFELIGFAPAHPMPDFDFFRWWLDQGYAGTMSYLHRGAERRGDPGKILSGVRSIICLGLNYHTGLFSHYISNYVLGEDYHRVIGEKLKVLEMFIQTEVDPDARTKSYVDTGAILERSYASQAGLGWIGKNTCLINNGLGSFFFIGEILTTLEFEENDYGRPEVDQCGSCTKCLDACPTQAFVQPYVMDANRCISYLTIEYRGEFSAEQKEMVGEHLYGCDICQQVCPYNDRIPSTPLAAFQPREGFLEKTRENLGHLTEKEFKEITQQRAMDRISYGQWLRNVKKA